MAAPFGTEPISAGSPTLLNGRNRPARRSKTPDERNQGFDDGPKPPEHQTTLPALTAGPDTDHTANFAAALLAASLPQIPQSLDDLVRHISTGERTEQSQARLKDFLA